MNHKINKKGFFWIGKDHTKVAGRKVEVVSKKIEKLNNEIKELIYLKQNADLNEKEIKKYDKVLKKLDLERSITKEKLRKYKRVNLGDK